jgi:cytochrome c biogenesis protein CcdA/thiol-disulfide isomerase/thioredoxin
MLILLVFSFLAGIVTILSPCILPILPLVLSGGITGGKKRPFGIVAGFVLSFTFFTLFLSLIVRATGLSADALRFTSVVVVAAFGVSMLVPRFQVVLEKLFSRVAGVAGGVTAATSNRPDFIAGFLIGMSLGLVWTPCVGPILAAIITLAATSQVTVDAVFITLAYSLGTAIPLLAITQGGRSLLTKHPSLVKNSATIQKVFGVLMIATAIAIYTNVDRQFQAYILTKFPQYGLGLTKFEDNPLVRSALEDMGNPKTDKGTAPELIPGGVWFNTPDGQGLTLSELRGKVVLVDFWTYTCINCIRTLPYLRAWHKKYADDGLVIIGVHTPEFEFEKNPDNVEKAIKDFALEYAVMQDNDYATWRAYNNRYWPAKYLIDKEGRIVYTHFGEGAYDETEAQIQKLLSVTEAIANPTYAVRAQTPELYLGYLRIDALASPEQLIHDRASHYSIPQPIPVDTFAFAGEWTVGPERAMSSSGGKLVLHFDAQKVFLVMRPEKTGTTGRIRVLLDGKDTGKTITVNGDQLYEIISLPTPGEHILQLEFLDGNVELYAFTFG